MSDASTWPYPLWIAHRGAGKRAPENTLAAFKLGASLGYRMFECDVQISADGVPFLLHDDTLERTTNGAGLACAKTWAELRAFDAGSWHSSEYASEPIPSLDEIGRFCRERGLLLNLEIKPSLGEEERSGRLVAQAVARDWAEEGKKGRWPLLSSFKPQALNAARKSAPQIPRALLLEEVLADSISLAKSLGCVALIPEETLINSDLLHQIHQNALKSLTYTVNDSRRAEYLFGLGLDGLISDSLMSSLE